MKAWLFSWFKTIVICLGGVVLHVVVVLLFALLLDGWIPLTPTRMFWQMVAEGFLVTLISSLWGRPHLLSGLLGGGTLVGLWALRTFVVGSLNIGDDPYTVLYGLLLGFLLVLGVLYLKSPPHTP